MKTAVLELSGWRRSKREGSREGKIPGFTCKREVEEDKRVDEIVTCFWLPLLLLLFCGLTVNSTLSNK